MDLEREFEIPGHKVINPQKAIPDNRVCHNHNVVLASYDESDNYNITREIVEINEPQSDELSILKENNDRNEIKGSIEQKPKELQILEENRNIIENGEQKEQEPDELQEKYTKKETIRKRKKFKEIKSERLKAYKESIKNKHQVTKINVKNNEQCLPSLVTRNVNSAKNLNFTIRNTILNHLNWTVKIVINGIHIFFKPNDQGNCIHKTVKNQRQIPL
ncbi:uncharacterized protein LOC126747331 [Anthonomus grandis grandis]|uniref:uncharacterized protein LOC126747331 n=1 Tax=Anthonomus grandis grandis TaxID=2921223 RepID=UPI002166A267|nr:uncharacterized protein LOC126747331 [Anthonomus grandis grandis]